MFRKLFYYALIVTFILGATGAGLLVWGKHKLESFMASSAATHAVPREVRIPKGTSLQQIATDLFKMQIITDPLWFRVAGRYYKYDRQLQAGRYRLSAEMSPQEIYRILIEGKVILDAVTFPEGLTVFEVADIWESGGYGTKGAFIEAVNNHQSPFMTTPSTGWEGYLFPDTYHLPENTDEPFMVKLMVSRFREVMEASWLDHARKLGYTLHQVVTLASLIEKETNLPSERTTISSVFHNRLDRQMLLQCDPTVIYGMGSEYSGRLLKKHLRIDHPYNTYLHPGLPPGPIASPGKESLYAACFPENTDYLYFVVNPDGGHYFSKSLREHNNAVRRYRRFQASNR